MRTKNYLPMLQIIAQGCKSTPVHQHDALRPRALAQANGKAIHGATLHCPPKCNPGCVMQRMAAGAGANLAPSGCAMMWMRLSEPRAKEWRQ